MAQRMPGRAAVELLSGRAPRVVASIVVLLVALEGVDIASKLRVLYGMDSMSESGAPHTPPNRVSPDPGISARQILPAHLFGDATVSSAQRVVYAPSDLKLTGTLADATGHGYAIIAAASSLGAGIMHLVRAGNIIIPGFTLSQVFPDHVLVLHDNTIMVLALPRFTTIGSSQPLRRRRTEPEVTAAVAAVAAIQTDHSFDPPPLPASGAILRSLNLRPEMSGGRRVGLRVDASDDGKKTREVLGLSAGDIVVNINGDSVSSQSGAGPGALMRAINAGETATLTVQRDGQLINVAIDSATADNAARAFRAAP
jgi:Type II secretion system protein C